MKRNKKHTRKRPIPAAFEFNIFAAPRYSPEYFLVRLHRRGRDLRAWRARFKDDTDRLTTAYFAFSKGYDVVDQRDNREIFKPDLLIGDMNFSLDDMPIGIIVHEAFHAVLRWCNVRGCRPFEKAPIGRADNEEIIAECIGSIVSQILVKSVPILRKGGIKIPDLKEEERYYL